jgi:phosphosulfolactate phosphohydrolase-like enzyme
MEGQDIELEGRDLVLRSPNGTRFRLVVDDNGAVSGEVL